MTCENGHDGSGDDFGCKVKSISVSPYAMPSRLTGKAPKQPVPRWERGIPTDSRGMPFLDKNLQPVGMKQYVDEKHAIEEKRRMNHQLSTP